LRYDGTTPALQHLALSAGEDTAGVLGELGMSAGEVEELECRGIVRSSTVVDAVDWC
jgi:crotonobetainyl-CoA:carnitine CoA-transferase CaiB-like acyl-CoA transferase